MRILCAVLLAAVVLGLSSMGAAHAADVAPPPLQQQRDGIPLDAIQCNVPNELYIRGSDTPLCLRESTYERLVSIGLDLAPSDRSYLDIINAINLIPDVKEREVQQVVSETIKMYESDTENAFSNINSMSEDPQRYYPFVLDFESKTIAAHGTAPDRIGTESSILSGDFADRSGDLIVADILTENSTWVEYVFLDPATNTDRLKKSLLVLHDGYVFGAGYYYSLEEKMDILIENAIAIYDEEGIDALSPEERVAIAHYVYVLEPVNATVAASQARPDLIGREIASFNIPTEMTYSELASMLGDDKEAIRYYTFTNPATGEYDQRRTTARLHDGLIFVAGYFYPAEEKVMRVVQDTITLYESNKENAFDIINSHSTVSDPHYPFVLHMDSKKIVAHGAFPEVVGDDSIILGGDYANIPSSEILESLPEGPLWINYTYPIPGTDHVEIKDTYLMLHDGYVFGAGYYRSIFTVFVDIP